MSITNAERRKSYRERHPEKVLEAVRRWARENPEQKLLCEIRRRAKDVGLPFDLTLSDVMALVAASKVCPVFGTPFTHNTPKMRDPTSPTVDRIIPALGYVRGNVTMISWRANRIKNNATLAELRQLVAWMEQQQAT